MGGKLFNTERINREKYDYTLNLFKQAMAEHNITVTDIPFFRQKDSFGDIDVITTSEQVGKLGNNWLETLTETLNKYSETETTGKQGAGVKSFKFNNTQVDLIYVPDSVYERTYQMLSWNDLSGFVGIVMRKLGLKLSNKKGIGIKLSKFTNYEIEGDDNWLYFDLPLEVAINIVGLDYERFLKGFDTKEEIFDYVTSSPYYSYGLFSYENGNNKHRQRNKERGTFKEMLEYCETHKRLVEPKEVVLEEVLATIADIVGEDLYDLVFNEAQKRYLTQQSSRILRDCRMEAISKVLDLIHPDLGEVEQKKQLGEYYKSATINSGMSIEEIVTNLISNKLN